MCYIKKILSYSEAFHNTCLQIALLSWNSASNVYVSGVN